MPSTSTKKARLFSGTGVNISRCPRWATSMIGSFGIALLSPDYSCPDFSGLGLAHLGTASKPAPGHLEGPLDIGQQGPQQRMTGIGKAVDDVEMVPAGLLDRAGPRAQSGPDVGEQRVLPDEFRALRAS